MKDLYGSSNENAKNALKPRCNWNLFDYYNWNTMMKQNQI